MVNGITTELTYAITFTEVPVKRLFAKMRALRKVAEEHGVRESVSFSLEHAVDVSYYNSGTPAYFHFTGKRTNLIAFIREAEAILFRR